MWFFAEQFLSFIATFGLHSRALGRKLMERGIVMFSRPLTTGVAGSGRGFGHDCMKPGKFILTDIQP